VARLLKSFGELLREVGEFMESLEVGRRETERADVDPRLEGEEDDELDRFAERIEDLADELAGNRGQAQPATEEREGPRLRLGFQMRTKDDSAASDEQGDEQVFAVARTRGGVVAIPWDWVREPHPGVSGAPMAFNAEDPLGRRGRIPVEAVLGLWTRSEIENHEEPIAVLSSLDRSGPAGRFLEETTGGEAAASRRGAGDRDESADSSRHWRRALIVSPSALARRFLSKHLESFGFEVQEARDLGSAADLESVGVLFLDESLRQEWSTHPAARGKHPAVVLLTVEEQQLWVPPDGVLSGEPAHLPRPFARAEVEQVVSWLDSLSGREPGKTRHGGQAEDFWYFANPFGTPPGEHPGGR